MTEIQKPPLQHMLMLVNLVSIGRKFGASFQTAVKFLSWQDPALMGPRPTCAL